MQEDSSVRQDNMAESPEIPAGDQETDKIETMIQLHYHDFA